ncbi:MAG: hypothetical protein OEY01_12305 [Desulfobulbaceae bacterium]|nr:hypothetical protein [Desulfobulbaceae bacterium]HIJ79565.1 hypothetical protein [Deltaproteobacteria bacterium]
MNWFASLKPGASIRTHLFSAALMWSLIGIYLLVRGGIMLGVDHALYSLLGIMIGTAKSFLVLDRAAGKNIGRILVFEDGACIGGVYSFKMWGMVVCMMIGGRLLRHSGVPVMLLGIFYIAVGWGLFFSSRLLWRQWQGLR